MLYFVIDATDAAGNPFSVVLQVPTQASQGKVRWAASPGKFSFQGGEAAIIASPADSRGNVVCIGKDTSDKLWTVVEINKVFGQFTQGPDGGYGALALYQSGSGYVPPQSAVSVREGSFTWTLTTLAPTANDLEKP